MPDKVLYTAEATSSGDGRNGHVVSSDHRLDLDLAMPPELGGSGNGTNPEQLFAAAYAACFHSALRGLARRAGVDAGGSTVTAQVGVGPEGDMYGLAVTLVISIPGADQDAYAVGIRVSGRNAQDYLVNIGVDGLSYAQEDVSGLPAVIEFDAASLVLTAYGRVNAGTIRGDRAVADQFLNSFFRI
jgi:lipoyl-dependent peroxiredoxin